MNAQERNRTNWWLWIGVALTVFKLWLTRSQPVFAIGNASLDDRLVLELAQSLVRGEWLGSYNEGTLAKGAGYSLFIALAFYLGVPLGLAQQGLYALACALFSRALKPVGNSFTQLLVYLTLLWNPMSYEAPTMGRIMRQHLVTPLGIMIFASLVALYLRRTETFKNQWPWIIMGGFATGIFWITREESVWILPSILLLLGAIGFQGWKTSRPKYIALCLIGLSCAMTPSLWVSLKNHQHYGWFGTVEFKASEFKSAYGSLQRVKVGPELAQVPVSREARAAIYQVSPAFASLKPWLEREEWTNEGPTPADRQIKGGWFMWALRESVAHSGQAPDARSALAFYQILANEVNAASDAGLLPARPRSDSLIPPIRANDLSDITRTSLWFADFVASFTSFSAYPQLSVGDREELKLFHDLTGDRISSSIRAPEIERPNQKIMQLHKMNLLQRIGTNLGSFFFAICFVTHLIILTRIVQLFRSRSLSYPIVLAAAAWGGVAVFILINALVHVLSFSVIAVSTFAPIYPLLIIFHIAVFWDAYSAWFSKTNQINRDQISA